MRGAPFRCPRHADRGGDNPRLVERRTGQRKPWQRSGFRLEGRRGDCVVIAVADTGGRGFYAGLGQALGVFDRQILRSATAVVHEARAWLPLVNRLFQSVEDEVGVGRPAHPPTDDASGKGVDHEGDEARPGSDVGEVADLSPGRRCSHSGKDRACRALAHGTAGSPCPRDTAASCPEPWFPHGSDNTTRTFFSTVNSAFSQSKR